MTYNPFDGKPPKTLGEHIVQRYLGENGVATGSSPSNQTGLMNHDRRKKEQQKNVKKPWWAGGSGK